MMLRGEFMVYSNNPFEPGSMLRWPSVVIGAYLIYGGLQKKAKDGGKDE